MHFILLDTETTGLDQPRRPVEVAWLVLDDKMNVLDTFNARVNPGRPINPGATEIHGIKDEDVAHCPAYGEVVSALPKPFVALGHNVKFDLDVLAEHIEWSGEICTLALARRWVGEAPNHKLPTLKTFLNLSDQQSHSALGDCYTSLEVLRVCSERSGRNLLELLELESVPKMLPRMPFGMHKGKMMQEVPASYREWLRSKPDLHKDLRYTLDKLAFQ
jgi:exodeoxyribonuclease X